MTVYLNGTDISDYVQRDTISVNSTLNLYGNSGNAGQASMSFTLVLDSNNSIKPRCGNEVIFVGDDGYNRRYFGGIVVNISFRIVGFNETGQNVIEYQVDCRDLSILFDKAYVSPAGNIFDTTLSSNGTFDYEQMIFDSVNQKQGLFSVTVFDLGAIPQELIGETYEETMLNVAQLCDSRIRLNPNSTPSNVTFNRDMQVARISIRQFIDQLSQEAGLTWWIDENFQFNYRSLNSMTVNYADSYFNISDDQNSLNYYGLELNEEFQNLTSQALVTGNFYDAGSLNIRNAIDGVQRWQEVSLGVVNENALNNAINRMYPGIGPAQPFPNFNESINPITGLSQASYIFNQRPIYGNGYLTDPVNSSLSYFENLNDLQTFLNTVGQNFLNANSSPRFMGSVSYHDRIPYVGQSVRVRLSQLGIDTYMIITGINITSSGDNNSGNDQFNRKYSYKVTFGDLEFSERLSRMYRNNNTLQIRPDRNIKPGVPTFSNYIYTQDNSDPLLILGINLPIQNNTIDKLGLPQPQTPAIYINQLECRVTKNPSQVFLSDPQVHWEHYTKSTELELDLGNGVATGFEQYALQYTNIKSGINYGWRIKVPDAENLYFQVRCISSAGEPSDWTPLKRVKKGDSKDENDNDVPPAPGALTGVSGQMDAGSAGAGLPCCPRTPVPGPSPPPAPTPSPSLGPPVNRYGSGDGYFVYVSSALGLEALPGDISSPIKSLTGSGLGTYFVYRITWTNEALPGLQSRYFAIQIGSLQQRINPFMTNSSLVNFNASTSIPISTLCSYCPIININGSVNGNVIHLYANLQDEASGDPYKRVSGYVKTSVVTRTFQVQIPN